MEIFNNQKIYNFMGKKVTFGIFSLILILLSFASIATKGINWGVDFAGGTVVQLKYNKTADLNEIRDKINSSGILGSAAVTKFGSDREIVIKGKSSSSKVNNDLGKEIKNILKDTGTFEIRRIDMVGPKVGDELREKGLMAVSLALLGILIYVAFRFEWKFAISSIIPLFHDIIITIGMISVFQIEVNLDVLAGILTIVGYSLNDTIIVFDRIREWLGHKIDDLNEVINQAVSNTLSRTTLTSLTTFFVVLTLFLFGGEIINPFSFTLLVGIVVGTYSSIFIASPSLIAFKFDVKQYKENMALKEKRRKEKERLRAQFEDGMI